MNVYLVYAETTPTIPPMVMGVYASMESAMKQVNYVTKRLKHSALIYEVTLDETGMVDFRSIDSVPAKA